MHESFSTAIEISEAFFASITVGAAVVLVMAVLVLLLSWDHYRKFYVIRVGLAATVGLACALWGAYASTFGCFVAAEVSGSELRLLYVGPFRKEVTISGDSVDSVLFGTPGKSNYPCYIKITTKSGDSYRSTTRNEELSSCKKLRMQILRALAE